ncbi:acetoacetate--CoA ligase [Amycolatopsis sp. NBC_01480]|uniref:acetoacetate--CoA ligase n=1 Tax=Amycolatopsis sp. NBC_01480 TaxID=2903562 RepID=UPI002E2E5397|nr:acetoacetate--CoA ligase [Amycolatopsis sp. NBC_01480]
MSTQPSWVPSDTEVEQARITDFARYASARTGHDLTGGYQQLWDWSVRDLDGFWSAVWDYFGLPARPQGQPALAREEMPGSVWFPGSTLNYTAEVFRGRDDAGIAAIGVAETGAPVEVSWGELRRQVGSVAAALSGLGVRPGDRVVGYLPNSIEAMVAFLATASLGAIWAVCGLDYVGSAAEARFAQLEPTVLFTATRSQHGGRLIDRSEDVAGLRAALPTLAATIVIDDADSVPGAVSWSSAAGGDAGMDPVPVPFDHPLWVLFSSGTTGRPKGMVHGHGGVVVEQLKQFAFHHNLGPSDRILWYTTPSWMMWNSLVGSLLVGSTVVCYDGSPAFGRPDALWELAARLRVTVLGTSPGYLASCRKAGVRFRELEALLRLGVTGSPLPADLYDWVAGEVGPRVQVVSSSGGTDVVTAFVSASPTTPVWAGELSAACLGVALESWGPDGKPVRDAVGELVVRRPMPSMPVRFWNDPDGSRYRDAYFGTFPGVWRHGDWTTITGRGSVIIHGRSDATLNRHGVRMGSSDIYGPVEELDEVKEALVIGVELAGGEYWMPLFVTTADGVVLDEALRERIREAIRHGASPRHVPDEIVAAPGIPHTRTGKKLEVPVKRLLRGDDPATVADPGSIDQPGLLGWYHEFGVAHRDY